MVNVTLTCAIAGDQAIRVNTPAAKLRKFIFFIATFLLLLYDSSVISSSLDFQTYPFGVEDRLCRFQPGIRPIRLTKIWIAGPARWSAHYLPISFTKGTSK